MRCLGETRAPLPLAIVLWLLCTTSVAGLAEQPSVEASAAVLMDAATGTVLFDKAGRQRRPMASTTKVMTALITLESADLSEDVTISDAATKVTPSALGLQAGETVSLRDLLTALLLESANDAAVAIAEHISGSVEAFADRMNQRARALGAAGTNFANPHGLYHPNHFSSARDLALITREAMKHSVFRELVGSKQVGISRPIANGTHTVVNHNKLLWQADFVDGVKTGYVRQSGYCLVASGTKDDWQLIAVVLDSPDMYAEALRLLEYGFSTYSQKVYAHRGDVLGRARVRRGRRRSVPAVCDQTLSSVLGPGLPQEGRLEVSLAALSAPVEAGQPAGEARLIIGGESVARSPLFAAENVPRSRLIVAAIWALRFIALVAVLAVLVRTNAKIVKAYRRRRSRFPAQGRRPDPRRPGPR